MNSMDESSPLSYEYVHETIFRKLSDTCVKYRDILPEIDSIEKSIVSVDHENFFTLTIMIIDTLKKHAERSKVVQEVFDNVRMDFWHGLDPRHPPHQGKYYISSVADEN